MRKLRMSPAALLSHLLGVASQTTNEETGMTHMRWKQEKHNSSRLDGRCERRETTIFHGQAKPSIFRRSCLPTRRIAIASLPSNENRPAALVPQSIRIRWALIPHTQ